MKTWALVLVAWLLPATLAVAQPAPVSAGPYDWSGWYAGANVGYGVGSDTVQLSPDSPGAVVRSGFVSPALSVNPHGLIGGVDVGRNWQRGKTVYGLEAGLRAAGITGTVVGPILLPDFDFQTTHTQDLNWLGTLRGRVGVAVSDRALLFVAGGLAYGQAGLSTFARTPRPCESTNFCATGSAKPWLLGWTIGAGVDYALASNWSARAEYLYYDLGTIHSDVTDLNPEYFQADPGPDLFRASARANGSVFSIGLNYKFGP
jgi:outer membrane immunogenic protein